MINDKTSIREVPSLILKGFLMGAADVVPGVSGGTMALILGIYERLLTAIKSVNTVAIKALFSFKLKSFFTTFHWKFLLVLLTGIGSAIIFFTRIVPLQVLMFTHPESIYGLYFGLILGSIALLVKNLKQLEVTTILFIIFGSILGWWIVNLVPTQTPESYLFIFGSGALAISAMILPGISGSFILLILGKYQFILSQISAIGSSETSSALLILFVFGSGMIVGIAVFSRFLSWLLERFHRPTIAVLIGFLIGSLSVIWPFQVRTYEEVAKKMTVSLLSEEAQQAKNETDKLNKPEFYRFIEVLNPDFPTADQQVVIEKVKRKLIQSDPFMPNFTQIDSDSRLHDGQSSILWGFVSMLVGLVSVIGIQKLADKTEHSPNNQD